MREEQNILLLGLGNLLWADEGFGVRALEALHARYAFPENVDVIDGGTQGLLLLPFVEAASRMIIFDAIDFGLFPGSLRIIHDDSIPSYLSAKKMSLHQTGFSEVLALAALQGRLPSEIMLIGVQPVELEDYGGSLSLPVRSQIEAALAAAVRQLQDWGVVLKSRTHDSFLNPEALQLQRYESERPSAEQACRIGDARVMMENG